MSSGETRYFTREEAQSMLPEIDGLLADAQALFEQLEQTRQQQQEHAGTNGQVLGRARAPRSIEGEQSIRARLGQIVETIQSRGVILRDLRTGLIDFPALRGGEEIYLCWRRGEPLRIEWWHPVDTGIAGRQRL